MLGILETTHSTAQPMLISFAGHNQDSRNKYDQDSAVPFPRNKMSEYATVGNTTPHQDHIKLAKKSDLGLSFLFLLVLVNRI